MPRGATVAIVIRRRAIVHGRVQGVFFRDTTCRQAAARGVAGWVGTAPTVRSRRSSRVSADAVGALLAFCREGPRGAAVERVEVFDEEPEGLSGIGVR